MATKHKRHRRRQSAPTAHRAAPKRKTTHRRRRRSGGLSEGLSARGMSSAMNSVFMGLLGGGVGFVANMLMKNTAPVTRLGVGIVAAGASAAFLKAPIFSAGLAAGVAIPAVAEMITAKQQGMNEGAPYMLEELPEIITDGEELGEGYLSAPAYLSENYLSEGEEYEDLLV